MLISIIVESLSNLDIYVQTCTCYDEYMKRDKSSAYIWIYIYIHTWRALFLNVLIVNPKIEVAMAMPSSEIMFWRKALHKYVYIYTYIYSYVTISFLKENNQILHWHCTPISLYICRLIYVCWLMEFYIWATSRFPFPNLPKWETDNLLIEPSHLV